MRFWRALNHYHGFIMSRDIRQCPFLDLPSPLCSRTKIPDPTPTSAREMAIHIRKSEAKQDMGGEDTENKGGYLKILKLLDEKLKKNTTKAEMLELLKKSIIYDNCK